MGRKKNLKVLFRLDGRVEVRWDVKVSDVIKVARYLGAAVAALTVILKGYFDS